MSSPNSTLRRFFDPRNIAAYLTWVAVFALVLEMPASRPNFNRTLALVSIVGFLLVFLLKELLRQEKPGLRTWLLLGIEGLLSVLTCAFWPNSASPILTIIFLADCGMTLGAAVLISLALAVNASLWAIAVFIWHQEGAWRTILAFGGFQIFATLTSWYARRAEETALQLQETNAYLLATRSLLEESARDRERLRLARELHDVAGHKLTALKLNLTALQRDEAGKSSVDVAAQLATELLADIRGVVAQIRQHDGLDIRAALARLIEPWPAPPRFHMNISDDARLESVAQAETLMRAVQEAVTNVVRHSGAQNAWIELRREGNQIRLHVHDDGKAHLPLKEGFGIAGMRERLAQLAGSLMISRGSAGGLALDIHLPLTT